MSVPKGTANQTQPLGTPLPGRSDHPPDRPQANARESSRYPRPDQIPYVQNVKQRGVLPTPSVPGRARYKSYGSRPAVESAPWPSNRSPGRSPSPSPQASDQNQPLRRENFASDSSRNRKRKSPHSQIRPTGEQLPRAIRHSGSRSLLPGDLREQTRVPAHHWAGTSVKPCCRSLYSSIARA